MKIQRNALCPCGSSKKYKKCCLNSETNTRETNPTFDEIDNVFNFVHDDNPLGIDEESVRKIASVFEKYCFEDLIIALFAISAWIRNRSALPQCMSLHKALTFLKASGEKRISNYSELETLFNELKIFLPITLYNDLCIADFGEVYIKHENKTYPIITGTGHQGVYANACFLVNLVTHTRTEHELTTLLSYQEKIITSLQGANIETDENEIVFEAPSGEFWNSVNSLFKDKKFLALYESSVDILYTASLPIEKTHFIKLDDKFYPLYNTSILVDYYDKLFEKLDKTTKYRHVNSTIALLAEIYNFPNKQYPVFIFPQFVIKDVEQSLHTTACIFTIHSGDSILVGLDYSQFEDDNQLTEYIEKILQLQTNKNFLIANGVQEENGKGNLTFQPCNTNFYFLIIEPFTNITKGCLFKKNIPNLKQIYLCSAIDAFHILGFSNSIDEILQFINDSIAIEKIEFQTWGGRSNEYFWWKGNMQQFFSGAIAPDFAYIDYNLTEQSILSHFIKLKNIPKNSSNILFQNPLSWNLEEDEQFALITHKSCLGLFANTKRLQNNLYICFLTNLTLIPKEKVDEEFITAHNSSTWLIKKLFNIYQSQLENIKFLSDKNIIFQFLEKDYAKQVDNSGFLTERNKKYVFCDSLINRNDILIRYSIDFEKLFKDISTSKTRQVELTYFLEFIHPILKYSSEFEALTYQVKQDMPHPKIVNMNQVELDYYYSPHSLHLHVEDKHFVKARRQIAQICSTLNIQPGIYEGKDATSIIRQIQNELVADFEKLLAQYDKKKLHQQLLSYYATSYHNIYIEKVKYQENKEKLAHEYQKEFDENLRNYREKEKNNLGTLQYFIESNLFCHHSDEKLDCDKDDFYFLFAYADWLRVLQDNADHSYAFTNNSISISIEVTSDFIINTIETSETDEVIAKLVQRKYDTNTYFLLNDDEDNRFRQDSKNAFYEDTGVNFDCLLSLSPYLMYGIVEGSFEQPPNVFSISEDKLLPSIIEWFSSNSLLTEEITQEQLEKAFNFMLLDETKLKDDDGTQKSILPVWQRKNRINRFDVKPIILIENEYIFSPVVQRAVAHSWIHGIEEWFLPYEIGFKKLEKVQEKWKKRYEKLLVTDITKLFEDTGSFERIEKEYDLKKRFPKENYPEIGDYDVIAISHSKKEIWLIEAKFIKKVASIKEASSEQDNFFNKKRYPRKFQTRIDFFHDNIGKISNSMQINLVGYKIIPYMVLNKVLVLQNYLDDIKFNMISFSELENKLSDLLLDKRIKEN